MDQSTFDVNWDALSEPNNSEPNIVLQEVTDEFLRQYGLEQSEFDDEMFDMFGEVSIPAADKPTDMSLPPSPLPTTEDKENVPPQQPQKFANLTTEEVKKFIEEQENRNTTKKTFYDVKKLDLFLKLKGEKREIFDIDPDKLDEYVVNFILSVKRDDGNESEPTTIRNIISSIDRTLKKHKYPHTIINDKSAAFQLSRDALKAKQKPLKKMGKGNKPQAARP